MTIEKMGKIYCVRENRASWTLTAEAGSITVSYNVPKADCPTLDALREYVAESALF